MIIWPRTQTTRNRKYKRRFCNYYLLKGNIRRKGWIDDNGAIGFEVKVLDDVNLKTKPGENDE